MDEALIAELYEEAKNPKSHEKSVPTHEQIKILQDLYGKVPQYKIATAFHIGDKTLSRWINQYIRKPA